MAKRMKSFVYDPRGTFRGWLWRICHHEAIDLIARRKIEQAFPLDERDEVVRLAPRSFDLEQSTGEELPGRLVGDAEANAALAFLFRMAEEIQSDVRRRVEPHTWEAFWLVGVALWTVDEAATHLRMSHDAVYKAKARVTKTLQAEGRRRRI